MSFFQVVIPASLIVIGIVDMQYRKPLAELIVSGLGTQDEQSRMEWTKSLETVQLVSGIGFIVAGLGLALSFWMGFNPF